MVVHGGRRLGTVGTTPKQRHSNMAADRGEPPSHMVAIRRFAASHAGNRRRCHANGPSADGRRTARRPWPHLPEAWNRIKASLSVFQRREVKVLGFSVKACLRPQRMAFRRYCDPFAPVGANGKACGEAGVCCFSGTPPLVRGVSPPALGSVNRVYSLTALTC